MELTKVIFTSNEDIKNEILKNINLTEKFKSENYIVYEGFRELYKDEERLVFIYFINFIEALEYVKENYDIFKILITSLGDKTGNIDFKSGDVVMPNVFISKTDENPIFLEYVIGENYDLTKFGLILNGLCISGEVSIEDTFDITEDDIYAIFKEIQKVDLLTKSTAVLGVNLGKENNDVVNNVYNIIELVL